MKQVALFGLMVLVMVGIPACSDAPDSPPPPSGRAPVTVFPFGTDGDHPVLRNKEGDLGNVRDTGVTVMSGDRVEIRPSYLVREDRKPLPPQVTRQDNSVCTRYADVCIGTTPVIQHQCSRKCKVCDSCNIFGCYPDVCCKDTCQDVHTGDTCIAYAKQCAQQTNQWTEQTVYPGLGDSGDVQDKAPMKSAALLIAGLKLRFSYQDARGTPQQSDCALDLFKPAVDADKIMVQLANVSGCPPIFAPDAAAAPTLALVNAMDVPISYPQGLMVKTWDGKVQQQATNAVYLPFIDFAGTLTVFTAGN